jgi:hypothetical protein
MVRKEPIIPPEVSDETRRSLAEWFGEQAGLVYRMLVRGVQAMDEYGPSAENADIPAVIVWLERDSSSRNAILRETLKSASKGLSEFIKRASNRDVERDERRAQESYSDPEQEDVPESEPTEDETDDNPTPVLDMLVGGG